MVKGSRGIKIFKGYGSRNTGEVLRWRCYKDCNNQAMLRLRNLWGQRVLDYNENPTWVTGSSDFHFPRNDLRVILTLLDATVNDIYANSMYEYRNAPRFKIFIRLLTDWRDFLAHIVFDLVTNTHCRRCTCLLRNCKCGSTFTQFRKCNNNLMMEKRRCQAINHRYTNFSSKKLNTPLSEYEVERINCKTWAMSDASIKVLIRFKLQRLDQFLGTMVLVSNDNAWCKRHLTVLN